MKSLFKKALSLLLAVTALFGSADLACIGVSASADRSVIEVSSWDELSQAFSASRWDGATWKIVLTADLSADAREAARSDTAVRTYELCGCSVIFDFNGHTLSCRDDVSSTDLSYTLKDFLRIDVYLSERRTLNGFERYGSTLTFTDSVGGGGVNMYSSRAKDNAIAALHVVSHCKFYAMGDYYTDSGVMNRLVINSGSYVLDCRTERFGSGTLNLDNPYRGCVIADDCITEINGGYFEAQGKGYKSGDDDMCARELTAFGTCCSTESTRHGIFSGETVINGGVFVSNGYSVHHFDLATSINETTSMFFPYINSGLFSGAVGFVGMTFRYSDGNRELCSRPASDIIRGEPIVLGIIGSNNVFRGIEDVTLGDLHKCRSLLVIGDKAVGFARVSADGTAFEIERCTEEVEEYSVEYSIADWIDKYTFGADVSPYIALEHDGGTEIFTTDRMSVNYSEYPDGVTVRTGLKVEYSGCAAAFENVFHVSVTVVKEPPEIISGPVSVRVEPGETATLTVVADHASSYQWYVYIDGYQLAITEAIAGDSISGYKSSTLSVVSSRADSAKFYCAVTGSDGTVKKTGNAVVTFGSSPRVISFGGGSYHENGSAFFNLRADYLDNVTWFVYDKRATSDTTRIRTLEDFITATGVECSTKQNSSFGYASCEFKNVPSGFNGRYLVGYSLTNALGKVDYSPETSIPFTLAPYYPEITVSPRDAACAPGGEMSFTAETSSDVTFEWLFEIAGDGEDNVVMTVDELAALYPDVTFTVGAESGRNASLTISGADPGLDGALVYCRADGDEASSFTAAALMTVMEGDYITGDYNKDGQVDSDDAIYLLRHVLFPARFPVDQPADLDNDGDVDSDDAIYLLRHVLFPDKFPLR